MRQLVPPKGQSDGLAERNKHNGAVWKGLNEHQRKIFSARIFFALAGLPDFEGFEDGREDLEDETDESSSPTPQIYKLSQEEEALYRPIYEELVDQDRVRLAYADGLEVASAPLVVRRGLQSVRHINNEVCLLSPNLSPFGHFLLSAD